MSNWPNDRSAPNIGHSLHLKPSRETLTVEHLFPKRIFPFQPPRSTNPASLLTIPSDSEQGFPNVRNV